MRKTISSLFPAALAFIAAWGASSCTESKFHVEGNITDAKDSVLYFENMGLDGIAVIDSARLDESGSFSFKGKQPEAPEFYRLRIAGQIINLAVDSNEVITVKARYATMPTDYEVSGSEDCARIKELSVMQIDLQKRAVALERRQDLGADAIRDSLLNMVNAYKERVKTEYIFKEPKAASSYFALFQTLGNYLIFNPRSNRDDIKVYAAVATSWDTYYAGAVRGQNLHNIALEGLKNERIARAESNKVIDKSKITHAGLIDIQLTDNKGQRRSLTELKGKVVLLDFHVFGMSESPKRILMLRELYNKFHAKGFEIYQVSLDPDEHFWKQQTAALPWISVRDADGIGSQRLRIYNVQSLPEYFLIDRSNSLVGRSQQIKDLEAKINWLLTD